MSVQSAGYESACDSYDLAGDEDVWDWRLIGKCPKVDSFAAQKHDALGKRSTLLVGDESALVFGVSRLSYLSELWQIPSFELR